MIMHSTVDGRVESLVRQSWLVRQGGRLGHRVGAAWQDARARQWVLGLTADLRPAPPGLLVRALAMVIAVAMLVHLALIVLDARALEPLTLALPLVLLVGAVVVAMRPGPLAHGSRRRE